MKWEVIVIIIALLVLAIIGRVKLRGFFWRDKKGEELTFREFLNRWKSGVSETSPLQQTTITLWSYPALIAGILWGFVVTLYSGTYWMSLILFATMPITSMQILATWQKYKRLKETDKIMKALEKKQKRKR